MSDLREAYRTARPKHSFGFENCTPTRLAQNYIQPTPTSRLKGMSFCESLSDTETVRDLREFVERLTAVF